MWDVIIRGYLFSLDREFLTELVILELAVVGVNSLEILFLFCLRFLMIKLDSFLLWLGVALDNWWRVSRQLSSKLGVTGCYCYLRLELGLIVWSLLNLD